MKNYVETIKDSFIDFEGKEHHFVIAAVSDPVEGLVTTTSDFKVNDGVVTVKEPTIITKRLGIGVAICNPIDTFDEERGIKRAIKLAKKFTNVIYSTKSGYINTEMVQALIKQEAEYLKKNPEQYITNYARDKEKYLKKQEMHKLIESMSDDEKKLVESYMKNPNYLDKVNKYINYTSK